LKRLQAEETSNNDFAVVTVGDEKSVFSNLSISLAEIRKSKGVIGYILRSNSSALVDLSETEKISQYALLSWQIEESGQNLARQFSLGVPESTLVEGAEVKVLCMSIGENRLSVFMEKLEPPEWIIKRIIT
jgi:predicted regulator of Ras-like GTPase activity (Roadblock/LC7/MglB family)